MYIRRGEWTRREDTKEDGHVITGAETGIVKLQTKECQGSLAIIRSTESSLPLIAQEGTKLTYILISYFWPEL